MDERLITALTNLGSPVIMENLQRPEGERLTDKALRDELMGVLKGHFRPEFLNRIDDIIVFHALTRDDIRSIVTIQLDRVIRTAAAQNITVKIGGSLIDHLADVGYQPEFGARELKRQIRQLVETHLAKEMLAGKLEAGDSVELVYDKARSAVIFNKAGVGTPKTTENSSPPQPPDNLAPTAQTGA